MWTRVLPRTPDAYVRHLRAELRQHPIGGQKAACGFGRITEGAAVVLLGRIRHQPGSHRIEMDECICQTAYATGR